MRRFNFNANKLVFCILFLFSFLTISAQQSRKAIEFTGKIAQKYPIQMTLTFDGDSIQGYYLYEKFQTKIFLEGYLKKDSVILQESPDYESMFRFVKGFKGIFQDSIFKGSWIDSDRNKKLSFETKVLSIDSSASGLKVKELEGDYQNLRNSDIFIGSVVLKHIYGNFYCFEISNGTEYGCMGDYKGLLEIKDFESAHFTADDCGSLDFYFIQKKLAVKEQNCDLHGMRCPFEGSYQKSN